MSKIVMIEVWPKANEPGAFQVRIWKENEKRGATTKWFRGSRTFPTYTKRLPPDVFRTVCVLIEAAHLSQAKASWQRGNTDKAAYAHQKRSEAAGAC